MEKERKMSEFDRLAETLIADFNEKYESAVKPCIAWRGIMSYPHAYFLTPAYSLEVWDYHGTVKAVKNWKSGHVDTRTYEYTDPDMESELCMLI